MYTIDPKTKKIVPAAISFKEPEHTVTVDMVPGQNYSASKEALAVVERIEQDKAVSNRQDVSLFMFPPTGQKVRTVWHEGNIWFVARDVAECLGYQDPSRAVIQHCKKSNKITLIVESAPRVKTPPVNLNIIPESDVYRLVMRSNLPSAEVFQSWVCDDVLPALRKTGHYDGRKEQSHSPSSPSGQTSEDQLILEAMQVLLQRTENLQAALTKAAPKARFYDAFLNSEGLISITDAAKSLGMTAHALGRLLRSEEVHWLFKNKWGKNIPMQSIIDDGYMVVKYIAIDGLILHQPQAFFTPMGMDRLAQSIIPYERNKHISM